MYDEIVEKLNLNIFDVMRIFWDLNDEKIFDNTLLNDKHSAFVVKVNLIFFIFILRMYS